MTDMASVLASFSQPSEGDKSRALSQALFNLGAGLTRAGAPTVGRPNPNTAGEAFAAFGQSLEKSRQQDLTRKFQALQALPILRAENQARKFAENKPKILKGFKADGLPDSLIQELELATDSKQFSSVLQNYRRSASAIEVAKIRSASTNLTELGKLNREFKAGLIDKATYDARVKKLTGESDFLKVMMGMTKALKGEGDATDLEVAKALGDRFEKKLGSLEDAGSEGERQIARMQSIRDGMAVFKGTGGDFGAISPTKLTASRFLSSIGVAPEGFGLTPEAAIPAGEFLNSQFAQGIVSKIGTDKGGIPANTFSEKDRELAKQMVANLDNSEEGIKAKLFVEEKAADVARQRLSRFRELQEDNEAKGMTVARAARLAMRKVDREFRGKQLFTGEERQRFRKLLSSHRRKPKEKSVKDMSDDALRKKLEQIVK